MDITAEKYYDDNLENYNLLNKIDPITAKQAMEMMEGYHQAKLKLLGIGGVIERYSGENLMKLQKHFVSLYGSDKMAQEKANSFAVAFAKACELIIKDLNAL